VVTSEACLVIGYSLNFSASKKETTTYCMGAACGDNVAATVRKDIKAGLSWQHDHHAAWQQNSSLVGPVGM
jgi:hypothetical protein